MGAYGLTSQPLSAAPQSTMTTITLSRDAVAATSDFFDEVKNGRDETTRVPGGYGSMPYIYTVEVDGEAFYGFDSDLPSDREPWTVGFKPVRRDSVLDAETLEDVDGDVKTLVNAVIEMFADDVSNSETVVDVSSVEV